MPELPALSARTPAAYLPAMSVPHNAAMAPGLPSEMDATTSVRGTNRQ
jgi:hypothetical protein